MEVQEPLPRLRAQGRGQAPNIETRADCTFAGSSSNGLGGKPRGPNQVLSSHNAVILASATTGPMAGAASSASAERPSWPNSASANRYSNVRCSRPRASWVVAQSGAGPPGLENLALMAIRLEARTTDGAQTAAEARPWRKRRRGTISELILAVPRRADSHTSPVAGSSRPSGRRRTDFARPVLDNFQP